MQLTRQLLALQRYTAVNCGWNLDFVITECLSERASVSELL
uniref:Uncharacterized protein n=1 Tax=Rheinheimera sp. BAL341 TaxID=1708203 RepID=A0A486XP39_9GAMM